MLKRYKARYPKLFPVMDTKESTMKLTQYFIDNPVSFNKPNRILIKSTRDHSTSSLLALLIGSKEFPTLTYLNSYELVEIFLKQHDVYESLSLIKSDVLFLTKGYGEIPNAQLNNLIIYMVNQYRGNSLIFYLKGRDSDIENILVKDYSFKLIDIDSILGQVEKPVSKSNYGGYDL